MEVIRGYRKIRSRQSQKQPIGDGSARRQSSSERDTRTDLGTVSELRIEKDHGGNGPLEGLCRAYERSNGGHHHNPRDPLHETPIMSLALPGSLHALMLPRPTQTRNSERAEQCWIAGVAGCHGGTGEG